MKRQNWNSGVSVQLSHIRQQNQFESPTYFSGIRQGNIIKMTFEWSEVALLFLQPILEFWVILHRLSAALLVHPVNSNYINSPNAIRRACAALPDEASINSVSLVHIFSKSAGLMAMDVTSMSSLSNNTPCIPTRSYHHTTPSTSQQQDILTFESSNGRSTEACTRACGLKRCTIVSTAI